MLVPSHRFIGFHFFLINLLQFQGCDSMKATCKTKLSDLKHSITKVICPGDCWKQHSDLCGTDDYARGPLCLAAMHAGLMDNGGGYFEVFKSDPLPEYNGVKRFGIKSKLCYSAASTYSFQMQCSTKGNPEFSVTDVVCPSGCSSNYVCGTQLYNSNSSVCAAAIHAGILKENGGAVTFYSRKGQSSFNGSTKNGVLSRSCDFSQSSFSFTKSNDCFRSCQNGGKCLSGNNEEFCTCQKGTRGQDCQIDIDECTSGKHNCHQHATCTNTVGSFQCSCYANYTGNGLECSLNICGANPGLCQHNGTCADTSTGYTCSCTIWYKGNNCETVKQNHQLTNTSMTWANARSYCQSIGGDLATWGMRNASIRNPTAAKYWIGLSDIEQEGVWKYVDGVAATDANTDFYPGEPNDNPPNGADCGHLNNNEKYQMDDGPCAKNRSAICERTLS